MLRWVPKPGSRRGSSFRRSSRLPIHLRDQSPKLRDGRGFESVEPSAQSLLAQIDAVASNRASHHSSEGSRPSASVNSRSGFRGGTQGVGRKDSDSLRPTYRPMYAAKTAADLFTLKALRLHPLKGGRKGQHSLSLDVDWRVVVRFEGEQWKEAREEEMSRARRVWPDVAIAPGATLAEEIEARGCRKRNWRGACAARSRE
jgi:plasmid maintenance system killer protein